MLSAQKEERRLRVVSSASNAQTLAGFGKVLNSIQGLQQRLEDFSVEDISKAAEKAKTLALHLSELQRQLATVKQISKSIAAVREAVDHIADEASELTKPAPSDRPLQLHAIVQASKLIRFPRLAKGGKDHSRLPPVNPTAATSPVKPSNSERFLDGTVEESMSRQNEVETVSPPAKEETAVENLKPAEVSAIAIPVYVPTIATPVDVQEPAVLALREEPAPAFEQASQTQPLEFHNPASQATPEGVPALQPIIGLQPKVAIEKETKAWVPANPDFDQRLLDDLIKNYGEFAASPNLPAPIKPAKDKKTDTRPESNAQAEAPANKNLPRLEKQGELDRQLKRLIKDYGEYDLYSRRAPITLKTGVIGAFLLLGLVFSGFYFLYAPNAANPPQSSSASQPASESSTAGALPANVAGNRAKPQANEKKKPARLRQAAQAGESEEAPDNAVKQKQ
jgi:hypothetical protein